MCQEYFRAWPLVSLCYTGLFAHVTSSIGSKRPTYCQNFSKVSFIAFSYRLSEVVKNKNIDVSAKKIWTLVIVFSFVGVTINYTNYFVNIKGKGLVECEFHVQRHKDWMLNKYARTQEDCEKEGGREVSK